MRTPVRVLSRLFRRLFLENLAAAHTAGRLKFFGDRRGRHPKPFAEPANRRCPLQRPLAGA
jgi:hypothetical protein